MRVHQVSFAALLAATFAVPSISQAAAGPQYRYTVTALRPFISSSQTMHGSGSGMARLINNSGMICGSVWLEDRAFCYDAGHEFELPPLPDDEFTMASGINARGQVAGYSIDDYPDNTRAVVWHKGNVSQLPIDGYFSEASGINDAGHIVGSYNSPPAPPGTPIFVIAYLFKDGVVRDLGALSSARRSRATAINNKDQVVGSSDVSGSPRPTTGSHSHAFLYEGDTMRDLGTLGGLGSSASGINDHGQVVGTSGVTSDPNGPRHAFIYYNNVMHDLGAWPDGSSTQGEGINNLGQVVGRARTNDPAGDSAWRGRAFLWTPDTGYQDLNDTIDPAEGYSIVFAASINDRRQIVGFGCKEGLCGPVLLEPCGEKRR